MSSNRGRLVLSAAVLVVVTIVAYIPALRGGFIWDDDDYVTGNAHLRSRAGLGRIWFEIGATRQYYPFVFTTFWVEYHLWGLNPLGYHAVNVLLHATSAVLLWLALRRLRFPGAWLAAGIFALHPVQVESVAWITERKNVLSGTLYLAALLAYTRFCSLDTRPRPDRHRWWFYALALLLLAGALLSKTVTCSLPAAILLLLWWKRERLALRDVYPLLPLFALGLALAVMTVWMERHSVGTEFVEGSLPWLDRCLLAGRIVWFYVAKLVCPVRLSFIYPRWVSDPDVWWQYLYPLAALLTVATLWTLRKRIGRGPLVAVLFFGGTLLPALGFIDVFPMQYSYVADHFQYLACIGLVTLFAAVLTWALRRWAATATRLVRAQRTATVVILGALGLLTWRQGHVYQDLETLWRDTLRKNPSAWMAHNNLGIVLFDQGRDHAAVAHYRQALRLKPDHYAAHTNLANALCRTGALTQARQHYDEALRINPEYPLAHYNLGNLLITQGQRAAAIGHYELAARFSPNHVWARVNLAVALLEESRVNQAVEHLRHALRVQPQCAPAHYNLGRALELDNRPADAMREYQETLRYDPRHAGARSRLQALSEPGGP
ncbi:MAG: tetratricopeptide repeat protein [Planctomycetes bacterium]|nr:tetratricopeptide repeat protein [Planctomycetota bacterium]